MTARIRSSKQHKSHPTQSKSKSNPNPNSNTNAKENTMTTTTKKHTNSTQSVTTNPASAADVIYVAPPPASANIPVRPTDWKPPIGTHYFSIRPKTLELSSLPEAVKDLVSFTDYPTTLGKTAPAYAEVLQLFDAASKWSSMRNASASWDEYCAVQEGVVWTAVRAHMERMKPAFALAVKGDPSLATKYVKLTALLDAKQSIARKAVSTKRANKLAVQEGKMPTHGAVGKKRKRAAERAALAQGAHVAPQPAPAAPVQAPTAATTPVAPVNGVNGAAQHT